MPQVSISGLTGRHTLTQRTGFGGSLRTGATSIHSRWCLLRDCCCWKKRNAAKWSCVVVAGWCSMIHQTGTVCANACTCLWAHYVESCFQKSISSVENVSAFQVFTRWFGFARQYKTSPEWCDSWWPLHKGLSVCFNTVGHVQAIKADNHRIVQSQAVILLPWVQGFSRFGRFQAQVC